MMKRIQVKQSKSTGASKRSKYHYLKSPVMIAAAAVGISSLGIHSARAAALTWDTVAGDGATITAGNGTWDVVGANTVWNNAVTNVPWSQTSATVPTNSAIFGGADGTYAITLATALSASSVTFNNSGYTLGAASAQTLTISNAGATSIVVADGKTANIGNNATVNLFSTNNAASNTILVGGATGGILNIATGATLSYGAGMTSGNGQLSIRTSSDAVGQTGTINVAGTLSFLAATPTSQISLGQTNGAVNMNVNSGGLVSSASTGAANNLGSFILSNNGAAGTLTINTGGSFTLSGTANTAGINIGRTGTGGGTLNLNGGTLTTARVFRGTIPAGVVTTGTGAGTFNFNGGTLKPTVTNNTNFMGSLTRANVRNNGALIDTSGFDVTISQILEHSNIGGDNATDGGLIKNGAGILTLSGVNTYNGATAVNTGTLRVSGSLAAGSAVSVASGATLSGGTGNAGGTNTVNGATSSAGTVAPGGTGTIGTLFFGNDLTLSAGSINVDLDATNTATGGTINDLLAITGNLNASGSVLVSPNFIGGTPPVSSVYTLATYVGTLSGAANFVAGSRAVTIGNTGASNATLTLTYTGAAGASLKWNSVSSGAWDVVGTKNWFNTGTSLQDFFFQGDAVTFDDTAGVQTAITINTTVLPTSVSVNSNTNNFGFSGSNGIGGGASLTKSGASTLTIATPNSYTGGTNINGGTVSIAADNNLGASASTVGLSGATLRTTAGVTNTHAVTIAAGGGTINVNGAGQYFFNTTNTLLGSGALTLTGTGALVSTGAGNLRVAQTNTYNGAVTVNSGGIFEYGVAGAVDAAATFNVGNEGEVTVNSGVSLPNAITVNGGTNSVLSFENGAGSFSGNVALNANAIIGLRNWFAPATPISGTISGVISGAGGLTTSPGTAVAGNPFLTLTNANTYAGATTIAANTTLQLGNGGATGALSTGSAITNNGALTVNRNNAVVQGTDFSGAAITGAGTVNQVGTASTLTLNTANSFTGGGAIGVNGGSSVIQATATGALGTGSFLIVGNGGSNRLELAGTGITLPNAIFQNGKGNTTGQAASILNVSGNNFLSGTVTVQVGGTFSTIQSDAAGLLTLSNPIALTTSATTGPRNITLQGAGNIAVTGAVIDNATSAGGVVAIEKAGAGVLTLSSGGSNYTGTTSVLGGTLIVTSNGGLGNSSTVSVATTATTLALGTGVTNAIADFAGVSLAGGNTPGVADVGFMTLNAGVNETVSTLVLGGAFQSAIGTYGATGSGATNINDEYFSGTGVLNVTVPEPTSLSLLGFAGMGLLRRRRRTIRSR